jgi:fimbrial isopeptide formation D2 family protein/LPXTG-motif cell wall-anchored protein
MIFHDTLSTGLTFDADSVKVFMYETKHEADADTELNGALQNVTDRFVVKTDNMVNGETFTVGCEDVFAIENVTKDTAFVVYYEATLNEGAVIGGTGNPNEVYLEFSNNPYGDGTGETEIDKVTVYTYKVIVNKTDSHGHELEGAGFTLYKKNLAGEYVALGAEQKGDGMTTFTWIGLDDGYYKLEESTVPAGYNKMADLLFSISAEHSEVAGEANLALLDGGLMGEGVVDTGAITKDIVNNTGTVLPETGAEGTFFLITGSALLVMVAAVFMITRKKMSIYEN